jgi:hypothetical protein
MSATVMGWLLGTLLGMRHALEPDHLAAVSTLVAENRHPRLAPWLGAFWGLGHSLGLLLLGGTLAAVQAQLPETYANALELCVAGMLCALGARAMRSAWTGARGGAVTVHHHGGKLHVHQAPPAHLHVAGWTLLKKPLGVGLVHGLAGSGAVVALVLAHQPTFMQQLFYIALFGTGSILGMGALTGVAGAAVAQLVQKPRVKHGLLMCSGLLSVGMGLAWGASSLERLLG